MPDLIEAISIYYNDNGVYPKVLVSSSFYDTHKLGMADLLEILSIEINDDILDWELESS
ncbi:hypothetical protein [Fodinibius sediminis]|uniref:Uncharacterized protein n=1 Tax=Fodinibius sediminis TaxID=1214077 RepID=A0A521F2Q7_9BACT|nr:hypothetical protein [Fodinibius sediminis]SMO90472.1 hypothetical protein SAMN06265218_12228 [Fodinibius sediminis]